MKYFSIAIIGLWYCAMFVSATQLVIFNTPDVYTGTVAKAEIISPCPELSYRTGVTFTDGRYILLNGYQDLKPGSEYTITAYSNILIGALIVRSIKENK